MPFDPVALKKIREHHNLTQLTLAEHIGSHRLTIVRLETGVIQPSVVMLEKLAKSLKVPITKLLTK